MSRRSMNRVLVMILASCGMASANLISFKTYTLSPPSVADNFEASIGDGKIVSAKSDVAGFTATGQGSKAVKFKTENVIPSVRQVTFTFKFEDYSGESFTAYWTYGDQKIGNNVLTMSQSLFDDGYAFANLDTVPLLITDLQFAVNVGSFDIDTSDPSTLSFGPSTSLSIAPGSVGESPLGSFDLSELVVARGTIQFGDGTPFNFLAVSAVPEPSSAAHFGIALLLLAAGISRKRGRGRGPESLETHPQPRCPKNRPDAGQYYSKSLVSLARRPFRPAWPCGTLEVRRTACRPPKHPVSVPGPRPAGRAARSPQARAQLWPCARRLRPGDAHTPD
jgi:hypothetical protein